MTTMSAPNKVIRSIAMHTRTCKPLRALHAVCNNREGSLDVIRYTTQVSHCFAGFGVVVIRSKWVSLHASEKTARFFGRIQ